MGRTAELELFSGALEDPEAFSVLWVHGPGGVGKTALLAAMADAAGDAGLDAIRLDMRSIDPAPPAVAAELAEAVGRPAGAGAADALAGSERLVLLLDTFELALGLEDWLREDFIPALPAGALTVIAGRARPGEGWRRDPGWRDLLRVVSLRNLAPDDARAIVARGHLTPEEAIEKANVFEPHYYRHILSDSRTLRTTADSIVVETSFSCVRTMLDGGDAATPDC